MKPARRHLSMAILVGCAGAALAQSPPQSAPQLTAPAARISDRAIQADYSTYEATQARIRALNERGIGQGPKVSDYHLSKAQCWLDVSFHEYTRNDRSAFPQQALEQSARLIVLMEKDASPLPTDTPLVNDAERLRPDLWDAATKLKSHDGYLCAAQRVACAEVELVHAGNENRQLGWRHAKPYVQMAEDLLVAAQAAAQQCAPPLAVALVPVAVPVARVEPMEISAAVVFSFGQTTETGIRAMSRVQFDQLIARAKSSGTKIEKVTVNGYADRLNGSGQPDFNVKVSQKRAQTVTAILVAAGVDRSVITTQGLNEASPVEACAGRYKSAPELEECLLPNRRVEVLIQTTKSR